MLSISYEDMKRILYCLGIFLVVFFVYFAVATEFSFKPKWAHDHFNPLAQGLLQLRFYIQNPIDTYDLIHYHGRWYAPWGVLSAIFLIPIQLIRQRFVPAVYLTIFFASLNVVVVYILLQRVKKEFLPLLTQRNIFLFLILFAFGTTHFYVGTLGSSWHVDQMVTTFFGIFGTYIIFKKKRSKWDYFLSTLLFSIALIGRPTIVFFVFLPGFLYIWEHFIASKESRQKKLQAFFRAIVIFGFPLVFFSTLFFLYNYLRFGTIFEYGYTHIQESPYLAGIREAKGAVSLSHIPNNLWYMLFESPRLQFLNGKFSLGINLNGNSIFILTLPFLTAFLAVPITKIKKKFIIDPYLLSLWLTAIIVILPSLMIYSSGWMQFGYRYSLDITVLLLLLSVFGIKGKIHLFYVLGTGMAIFLYILGIQALM